ncbi:hypothetical protein N9L68_00220 [bacterium]|nr:hypothetical protein [bacterium]
MSHAWRRGTKTRREVRGGDEVAEEAGPADTTDHSEPKWLSALTCGGIVLFTLVVPPARRGPKEP